MDGRRRRIVTVRVLFRAAQRWTEKGKTMSTMVKCDKCEKLMYTDSREDKGAYIKMTADDPLYGYSTFHLCRKCFDKEFPWLIEAEEGER